MKVVSWKLTCLEIEEEVEMFELRDVLASSKCSASPWIMTVERYHETNILP